MVKNFDLWKNIDLPHSMILRKKLLCSTRAIFWCCKWDLDFLSMLRFCLLIHTFREFRHKNFQKRNNNWCIRLAVDCPNNPILQSSSARQISLKYESPPILTTIWSPTEFRYPQQNSPHVSRQNIWRWRRLCLLVAILKNGTSASPKRQLPSSEPKHLMHWYIYQSFTTQINSM